MLLKKCGFDIRQDKEILRDNFDSVGSKIISNISL